MTLESSSTRWLFALLALASFSGDNTNYWIGHFVGPKVFKQDSRWLNRAYLDKTEAFYERHGGKTIIIARFVPIVRTFAPFVAGMLASAVSGFAVIWFLLGYLRRNAFTAFLAYRVGVAAIVLAALLAGRPAT